MEVPEEIGYLRSNIIKDATTEKEINSRIDSAVAVAFEALDRVKRSK